MKKTLYKKDSSGRIRILNFWCEKGKFKQESGLIDGKLVEASKICKGKNIGRSNETSSEEQAILEMNSKIKEKLQEGYFETEAEAKSSTTILPMLAKKYIDCKSKIDWNSSVLIQPKLDGMRCLAKCTKEGNVTLISRDGIDIQQKHGSMQHIIDELSHIKEDIILDGELYNMDLGSFQDQMKAIKKYRAGVSELINYNIYDCININPVFTRINQSKSYIKGLNLLSCVIVPTYLIQNEQELPIFHDKFLEKGYEGSIIRHGDDGYKLDSRSSNLLKYKDFMDNEYQIIDILPAENRPEWGRVLCHSDSGNFIATPKMSQEDKADLLVNKKDYIGKMATVTHFGFTDKGLPRFPIYKGLRLDSINK